MRLTVNDKGSRLEVTLIFPDSRLVDLEISLHFTCETNRWELAREDRSFELVRYRISAAGSFLATANVTHGLEPPTRITFDNKPPESQEFWPVARRSVISVTREFLEECAARGLVSLPRKNNAIAQLIKHDREIEVVSNG